MTATLCRYCGTDPLDPSEGKMPRAMSVHLVQEHPESPEYRAFEEQMARVNAEDQARRSSPAYLAAEARERKAFERLQPMKHQPLYHGTRGTFEPGDVISPQSKKIAHATASYYTAKVFAGGSKGLRSGDGRVYEVELIDPEGTWVQQMKYTGSEVHHEVVSPAGFRVKRLLPKGFRP